MKNYTGILEDLCEEMRITIQKKVAEKGVQSDVGYKTIYLNETVTELKTGVIISEVGENLIFDIYGYSYQYGVLDYEQLAEITDYINL